MKNYSKALLALAAVGSFALINPAHAVVSVDIQQGSNPPITLSADQQVLLHLPDMPQGAVLTFPQAGTQPITPAQQDTFYVDASTFQQREMKYVFTDGSGQNLASGTIINTNVGAVASTSLDTLTHYSTAYNYDKKPEPQYGQSVAQAEPEPTEVQPQENVRGYW